MELKELETIRIDLYKKYSNYDNKAKLWKKMIIVFFVTFGLGGLFAVFNMSSGGFILLIPVMIGFMLSGYLSTKYATQAVLIRKEFESKVKSLYIDSIIKKHYEKAMFLEKNHINIAKVLDSKLVKEPDQFMGEDYITGYYKDLEFEFSELQLVEITKDKNNKTRSTTYFKGFWIIINLPSIIDGNIKIFESNSISFRTNLKKIETEMITFNQKFNCYTDNEHTFFRVLNPTMIEKLLELESLHKGTIQFSFQSNHLHVGVNTGTSIFNPKISTEITSNMIEDLEYEILFPKVIIDLLSLEHIK